MSRWLTTHFPHTSIHPYLTPFPLSRWLALCTGPINPTLIINSDVHVPEECYFSLVMTRSSNTTDQNFIFYPSLPFHHLRNKTLQHNCVECTCSHWQCVFHDQNDVKCPRCIKIRGCTGEFSQAKAKKKFWFHVRKKKRSQKKLAKNNHGHPQNWQFPLLTTVANIHLWALFCDVNIASSRL